jgi:hypothetical protein
MLEFSFVCENDAEASYLAQELEVALLREGIPAAKLSLRQSSSENMDAGSILSFAGEQLPHMLGSLGYIACFAKCIYEVVTEHHRTIVIENEDGSKVRIPASKATIKRIESALTKPRRAKSKKAASRM